MSVPIIKNPLDGRYAVALTDCRIADEVVATAETVSEAIGLAADLNAAADGAQRELILASHDVRRVAA